MSQGKFQAGKKKSAPVPVESEAPAAEPQEVKKTGSGMSAKTGTIIAVAVAAVAAIILIVGIIAIVNSNKKTPAAVSEADTTETAVDEKTVTELKEEPTEPAETELPAEPAPVLAEGTSICGVDIGGLTVDGAVAKIQDEIVTPLESATFVVHLPEDDTLELSNADTEVTLDAAAMLDDAIQAAQEGRAARPLSDFITFNEAYVRQAAENKVLEYSEESEKFTDELTKETVFEKIRQEDGTEVTEKQEVDVLNITLGKTRHGFSADNIFNAVASGYAQLKNEAEVESTDIAPEEVTPEAIAALRVKYGCKEAVNASFDPDTFEIVPDEPGYDFEDEELKEALDKAGEGETVKVYIRRIPAEVTADALQEKLFVDVLGECDTPHTWINDRTHNLELACAEIDGYVLLPGKVFSFNDVVGERTKAKGYREAIAYVSGKSVPETGGGVCQVASTIYSACLYADMEIVESYAHQFFTTYTNPGMDTTIYWKSLDYKFRNNTEYPIKLEASVSGGYVHIKIWGTNTRDYTVKMRWVQQSTTPYETVYHVIQPGENYKDGQEITSPYTGRTYITYMDKYDLNGNLISTTLVRKSVYSKRDREIAVITDPNAPTEETTPVETDPPTPVETDPPVPVETDPPTPVETDPPAPIETDPPTPVETDPPAPVETDPPATPEPAPDEP